MAKVTGVTHKRLIEMACQWLHAVHRCDVVLPEFSTLATQDVEIPDVLGFTMGIRGALSILVECKTSRSDFLADRSKPTRACPALGMGQRRWFFTPPEIATLADVPWGWGLATWDGGPMRGIRRVLEPRDQEEYAILHERTLLVQEIRRSDGRVKSAGGGRYAAKRFRESVAPLPKQKPCRGAPFCEGCAFCMPGLTPEEIAAARAMRAPA